MKSSAAPTMAPVTDLDTFYAVTQMERLSIWFFDADWCGPCRIVRARYLELVAHYGEQVLFHRVDVDDEPGICSALHVLRIPATHAYRAGTALDWPWPGPPAATAQEEYRAWIDRHL
ncbi:MULTISPECIES: co-chaperone YbbN [unclassified Streptomyces]|uniref:thioredoxin family protein n=1 Tax=unclassified Streptomyces TaxID=2593676 RepID=UPI0015D4A3F8|nr:thioredoxin family protein [Streptomyces sp. Ru87]